MPQLPAERWEGRTRAPGQSATRIFDVPGAASGIDAIDQVAAYFSTTPGAQHPEDPTLYVQTGGMSVGTEQGPFLYTVRAQYGLTPGGGSSTDPVDREPTFMWVTGNVTDVVDRDFDGNAILNSAWDVPNPKPTRKFGTIFLVVRKWENEYDPTRFATFNNTINQDTFKFRNKTIQPGQACFDNYKQVQAMPFSAKSVPVEYTIEFRPGYEKDPKTGMWNGFFHRFLDKGRRAYFTDPNDSAKMSIQNVYTLDDVGKPRQVSDDVLLNGFGAVLKPQHYRSGAGTATSGNSLEGQPPGATFIAPKQSGSGWTAVYKKYGFSFYGQLGLF